MDSVLYLGFVFLVKGTSCLVEDQNLWLLDDGTSKCDSLLLASRKLATALTNIGIDSLRIALNKVPRVGHLEGVLNLVIGSLRARK